jgi:hypothetical protein
MSADQQSAVDQFFDEFKERFRALVRATVSEELEPLREIILRPAGDPVPTVEQLADAAEVAKLLGEDLSTDKARRRALQKVYDLARRNLIPSVRVSPRRVRFDLAAVRRALTEGGHGADHNSAAPPAAPGNTCAAARR